MKLITINVEDEEHTAIKLAATKAGLSIKEYLLRPAADGMVARAQRAKSAQPLEPTFKQEYPKAEKLCKHGMPPTFCKYAKPGKPCK